jgi:hypothetical protein
MNDIGLVVVAKNYLQDMRDNCWDSLLNKVHSFCSSHKIKVLNMEDKKVVKWSECVAHGITNQHYYQVNLF